MLFLLSNSPSWNVDFTRQLPLFATMADNFY
jgi:hypothetical protein